MEKPSPRPSPKGRGRKVVAGLAAAALAWSIASSLWVYPHSLSYFNELVGGPTGGPKHLIHSNVDWGQDLLFLKKWLDKHPEASPPKLAYFGYFDPIYAGIEYSVPEVPPIKEGEKPEDAEIPPGWYAISVNFVRGLPYFAYNGDGGKTSYGLKELARFQRLKPVAMAGYSIYIYYVPARDDTTSTDAPRFSVTSGKGPAGPHGQPILRISSKFAGNASPWRSRSRFFDLFHG